MGDLEWCKKFQKTISTNNQNSYKFAVGMAIVEIGKEQITYQELAEKLAEYYYRNVIRFKIRETTNINQQPESHKIISDYFENKNVTSKLTKEDKEKIANKYQENGVFKYVLPCWEGAKKNADGHYHYNLEGENTFFKYSKNDSKIILKDAFLTTIESAKHLLLDLAVIEWVRFLEKFNNLPNLVSKISYKEPNRKLGTFRTFFTNLYNNSNTNNQNSTLWNTCGICGNTIQNQSDLTLDHVIPFDYMWSDDLWNLVPAHKSCNSSKNMKIGNDYAFERLYAIIDYLFNNPTKYQNHSNFLQNNLFNLFKDVNDLKKKIEEIRNNCMNIGYKVYAP